MYVAPPLVTVDGGGEVDEGGGGGEVGSKWI
ncbi:hypothetical protein A2U01_0063750, partial [Trifolium medium]|nr:hypothetical protein [Trifolium medium]